MSLPPVQSALEASSALVAIVGTRISQSMAPEDQTRPYVVWFIATAVPENQLAGRPEDDDQRVQIDFYSASQSQCRQMMEAGLEAAEGIGHVVFGPWSTYEAETKLHRWSFDVEVWNPR